MFEITTEKVFHADDKYVLRLLNVVIHEHQFKRKGKYYKFLLLLLLVYSYPSTG
jgi:hypothetical protein